MGPEKWSPWPRKLHHKLMVIDEQLIITGSFNYTGPANLIIDENIIVVGGLESTDLASIAEKKKLAAFAIREIERFVKAYK